MKSIKKWLNITIQPLFQPCSKAEGYAKCRGNRWYHIDLDPRCFTQEYIGLNRCTLGYAHGRYQIANVLIFYNYEGYHTPKDERVEMVVKDLKSLVQ